MAGVFVFVPLSEMTLKPINKPRQSLFQVLSFDVVLGALSVGLFAITILDVNPIPAWWIILPLAVWSVYTLDHLIDGFAKKGESTIYRHKYHYTNRKVLIPLVIVASSISIVLSLKYLEPQIIVIGFFLSGFVMLYFILNFFQKRLKIKYIHKEVFIAITYLSGILLAPIGWFNGQPQFQFFILVDILLVLVWVESVVISYYDYSDDKTDQINSFTTIYGREKTLRVLIIVHIVLAVILFFSLLICNNKVLLGAVIIISVMNFILLALSYFPNTFGENNLFRLIGESVFILPVFIVLF